MQETTPSLRIILNWLAEARQSTTLSKRDLRRVEKSLGLLIARKLEVQ